VYREVRSVREMTVSIGKGRTGEESERREGDERGSGRSRSLLSGLRRDQSQYQRDGIGRRIGKPYIAPTVNQNETEVSQRLRKCER
jgi:hypothetical protein